MGINSLLGQRLKKTGEPNELVAQIHTRMPVILGEEHHEAWLTNQAGKEVLVSLPGGRHASLAHQSAREQSEE